MTPQLTKIRGLNPDAILVVGYVEPAAFVYRQAVVELGINVPRYGFTSGSEEQFLRVTTSEQMEGVWDLRPTELTLLSASKNGSLTMRITRSVSTSRLRQAPRTPMTSSMC